MKILDLINIRCVQHRPIISRMSLIQLSSAGSVQKYNLQDTMGPPQLFCHLILIILLFSNPHMQEAASTNGLLVMPVQSQ